MARVCHQVNAAWCDVSGEAQHPDWDDAPEWQRESSINGVEFALKNPDATPEDQHAAWLADKLAQGWRYGPVKDADAKTHPCILEYAQLPFQQQVKDRLFLAVVRSFATAANG